MYKVTKNEQDHNTDDHCNQLTTILPLGS